MAKEKLQYDSNGWAKLSSGVRLHTSGQGSVVLRSSGIFLATGKKQAEQTQPQDPSPADVPYVEFDFRMLSKAFIECYALDFSKDHVLKNATSLFIPKIYKDHETFVENSIGAALNPTWDDTKNNEGVMVGSVFLKSSVLPLSNDSKPIRRCWIPVLSEFNSHS